MKFKAVIAPEKLKPVLATLERNSNDAKFQVSESGIAIKSIDPANVALTAISIPSEACDFLLSDTGEIGIDVSKLNDMISDAATGEPISLELLEEEMKLKIVYGRLNWKLSLISPDSLPKEPRLPELDLPCMAEFESSEFVKIVKASKKVEDHIRISMEDDKVTFVCKGNTDKVEATIPITELRSAKVGYGSALFSLNYLEDIAKPSAKAGYVKLEWGPDYPLRASFTLNGGDKAGVDFQYLIAPRIETE